MLALQRGAFDREPVFDSGAVDDRQHVGIGEVVLDGVAKGLEGIAFGVVDFVANEVPFCLGRSSIVRGGSDIRQGS